MTVSIVLTGADDDANRAGEWAMQEALKAKYAATDVASLGNQVKTYFREACCAFFENNAAKQMVMLSLDLSGDKPSVELVCDGAMRRGVVSGATGLLGASRQRHRGLDGMTCVSVPAA